MFCRELVVFPNISSRLLTASQAQAPKNASTLPNLVSGGTGAPPRCPASCPGQLKIQRINVRKNHKAAKTEINGAEESHSLGPWQRKGSKAKAAEVRGGTSCNT